MTAFGFSMDRGERGERAPGLTSRGRATSLLASAVVPLLIAGSASAGGLYSNELSTTSQGNAGAGRGAWVPDASAALHNPAAMTRLDDHGFAGGLSLVVGNVRFDPASNSPSGNASGGNQVGVAPLASFSYAHRLSDRVRLGLSFYSISGSVLDPDNDWAGRFEMRKISLLTMSISPTLAVRVTDWLSIGGGPIASYAVLNWDLKAEFPPNSGNERNVQLNKLNDWQASGRVGVLLHPRKDFSLSVYYNSETKFNLSGGIHGPAGLNPNLDSKLPLAQFVEVSAYWQATDRLALLGTFDWEDWSAANKLDITLASRQVDATTGFKDTYKIGVGANYRLTDRWLLQTGLMYDTSALKNTDRSVALPVDKQVRFSLGAQHSLNDSVNLGMSFTYVNLGAAEVRNATVRGDYKDNDLFVFGATLALKRLPWSGKLGLGGSGGS
jgi:long-chain fatty acid transport protein